MKPSQKEKAARAKLIQFKDLLATFPEELQEQIYAHMLNTISEEATSEEAAPSLIEKPEAKEIILLN